MSDMHDRIKNLNDRLQYAASDASKLNILGMMLEALSLHVTEVMLEERRADLEGRRTANEN